MLITDQETILQAVHEAQMILASNIEPGPRDPEKTINELLAVFDRSDVVRSVRGLQVELDKASR